MFFFLLDHSSVFPEVLEYINIYAWYIFKDKNVHLGLFLLIIIQMVDFSIAAIISKNGNGANSHIYY